MRRPVLFRYLADPFNRPQWQSSLRAVTDVDPGSRTPACTGATSPSSGVKPHLQWTELVPFRTMSELGTWHGVDGLLTLRFVKVGDGTRLTAEGRVIGRGPFAVAAAIAGRWAPGTITADLKRASEALTSSH